MRARKLRDAAYTLVTNTERRLRTAAEYWYAGTDKMKDYAIFAGSTGPAADDSEDEEEAPAAPTADGGAPIDAEPPA